MQDQIIISTQKQFENIFENFLAEISKINIGQASINLVEDLNISYYGAPTQIKKIAQISTPDPKTIIILPWDKNTISEIENSINKSELNLSASSDGAKITISLPPLTEERRTELSKVTKTQEEEAKIALRNTRQKIWEEIQEKQKKGEYTEDDRYRFEEELNKLIDDYNKKITESAEKKSKEIMTI